MTETERLLAIHEIMQVKADYWLAVDGKDEALLASVFTDDAIIDYRSASPSPRLDAPLPSPAEFASRCLRVMEGVVTAHHGHNPRIRFESDDEAVALWPMEDNLWADPGVSTMPFTHLHGFGTYHDRYRRTPAGWKIAATTLQRSKVIMT